MSGQDISNWKYEQRKKAIKGGAAQRETTAKIEVMRHFANGGTVLMDGVEEKDPAWNWVEYNYTKGDRNDKLYK